MDINEKTCPCGFSKYEIFNDNRIERWCISIDTEGGLCKEFIEVNFCPECGVKLHRGGSMGVNTREVNNQIRDVFGKLKTVKCEEQTIDEEVYLVKTLNGGGGEYPDHFLTYKIQGTDLLTFMKDRLSFKAIIISVEKLEE